MRFLPALLLLLLLPGISLAERKTVCTITVNSSDEKETFRQNLPKDKFRFVELVEKGRHDWLASSCQKGIQCDVLVVSGHFNAGETFYSDKIDTNEYLAMDELERASCSDSCPGLFSKLKEVYLFGCESLNPDATNYSSAYGESGRDRMRRLFTGVPVIYGFYSSAPVGPTAAMLLGRYFSSSAQGEIFTGRPSPRLLSIFSRNHMTVTSGLPDSAHRRDICQFYDQRLAVSQKVAFAHQMLQREPGAMRPYFERIEKLFSSFSEEERSSSAYALAVAQVSADRDARDRFLAFERRQRDPALRARMISLARTLGWLSTDEHRAEVLALVNDVAAGPMGFVEVDLLCSLNADRSLDGSVGQVRLSPSRASKVSQSAVLACLGSRDAQAQVMQALSSGDDQDVASAQAYLRHRPPSREELRALALSIARQARSGVSTRALDTLARMHIADREILEELTRAFASARSVNVQRAIAEVFLRSDPKAIPVPELTAALRNHRLRAPSGGEDLIDVLLKKLPG